MSDLFCFSFSTNESNRIRQFDIRHKTTNTNAKKYLILLNFIETKCWGEIFDGLVLVFAAENCQKAKSKQWLLLQRFDKKVQHSTYSTIFLQQIINLIIKEYNKYINKYCCISYCCKCMCVVVVVVLM